MKFCWCENKNRGLKISVALFADISQSECIHASLECINGAAFVISLDLEIGSIGQILRSTKPLPENSQVLRSYINFLLNFK